MKSISLYNYYRDKIDYFGVNDNVTDGKSRERLSQPQNSRDADQPEQPPVPS